MNIPPIIILIFVGGWAIALLMFTIAGLKNRREQEKERLAHQYQGDKSQVAHIYNYIHIDDINGLPMDAYPWELTKKGKGYLASPVEIIHLKPGIYRVTAHGVTYQTTPTSVIETLKAGQDYCLGANEQGLYLTERSREWAQAHV